MGDLIKKEQMDLVCIEATKCKALGAERDL